MLLAVAPLAGAESLYVIEHLVVGVNSAPDDAGERIASVRSGERVEVLERFGDEVRVKLESGPEGWMKASYLSAEVPLAVRLAERTRELETARSSLGRVQRELAAAQAALAEAAARPAEPLPGGQPQPEEPSAAALLPAQGPLFPRPPEPQAGFGWGWLVLASAAALAAGFALGWRMLDRRIRRKYGGLRIY